MRANSTGDRSARRVVATLIAGLAFLGGASSAWAGAGVSVTPSFPATASVGATGLPASLTITNQSTPPESASNLTVDSITLVPSCGSLSFGDCPAVSADAGVLAVSSSAVGEAGTACAGVAFTVTTIDPAQGKLRFNPAGPVVLQPPGGPGSRCIIDFTFDVVRVPAKDADPSPGLQTAELAAAHATAGSGSTSSGFGSTETTVVKSTPGLTTQVTSSSGTVGGQISDTATLTPAAGSPAPTGTVTFSVYGPGDATCASAPLATSTVVISGATARSSPFTPSTSGSYRFVAAYSGDAANNPGLTQCSDPNEVVVVKGQPSITSHVVAATVAVGDPIGDTATVTPGPGAPTPTGSVTFKIYGPGDTACATPLSTVAAPLSGGTATSAPPTFTATTAGTYRFVASYNGDAANNPASGQCGDVNESVTAGADESPTAAYTPSTFTPAVGQAVTFNGTASNDPDGTIVTYRWVWNDGTPDGSGPTPTHTFTTTGLRSVQLYITDSDGKTAAVGHGITVGTADESPTAAYTPSTFTPAVGQAVTFNGTASNDPDGTIVTYRWVWNDGTPDGSGPTPTHTFTTTGLRSVQLYITDSDGKTAAVGHGITVGTADESPTAAYTPSTFTPAVGQAVTFNGTASNDPDGTIVTYRWVWNDGTPDGSGPTPTHTFTTTGLRSVQLYITDSDGKTAAVGHGITVSAGG